MFRNFAFFKSLNMEIQIEPKQIIDAYSTPIVQQTSFWSKVKERLGLFSSAYEFKVRNRDIYEGVGASLVLMPILSFFSNT